MALAHLDDHDEEGGGGGTRRAVLLWVVLPLANYWFWLRVGASGGLFGVAAAGLGLWSSSSSTLSRCPHPTPPTPIYIDEPCNGPRSRRRLLQTEGGVEVEEDKSPPPDWCPASVDRPAPQLELLLSETMTAYKFEQLARMRYPLYTSLVNHHPSILCTSYVNPHISQKHISNKQGSCLAVVAVEGIESSFNLLRFDQGPRWSMMTWSALGAWEGADGAEVVGGRSGNDPAHTGTTPPHHMPTGFFT